VIVRRKQHPPRTTKTTEAAILTGLRNPHADPDIIAPDITHQRLCRILSFESASGKSNLTQNREKSASTARAGELKMVTLPQYFSLSKWEGSSKSFEYYILEDAAAEVVESVSSPPVLVAER
jgi:hypothetical protein